MRSFDLNVRARIPLHPRGRAPLSRPGLGQHRQHLVGRGCQRGQGRGALRVVEGGAADVHAGHRRRMGPPRRASELHRRRRRRLRTRRSTRGKWRAWSSRSLASGTALGRIGSPAKSPRACSFSSATPASFVTGQTLWINGGSDMPGIAGPESTGPALVEHARHVVAGGLADDDVQPVEHVDGGDRA